MIFLSALIWIATTTVVISAAAGIARRLDPHGSTSLIVHTIILVWTWIISIAVLLSVPSRLSGTLLLIGVTTLALVCHFISHRISPSIAFAMPTTLDASKMPRLAAAGWIALLSLWSVHVTTHGLLKFTTDFDSLMYHTPLLDYWLQAGSLYAPDSTHWSNPGAAEVLGLWAVSAFSGDFLATLGNFPSALLLAFGALELGRLIGLGSAFRHCAAFVVVANFVVINQLVDTENDVAVAALFVVCLCYAFRYSKEGRSADLALGAASLGLLCGIKYYALGYAAVAWAAAIALCSGHRGIRQGFRLAITWGAGAVLFGGYWYLRNYLASGSPLFPMGIGAQDDVLHQEYPEPFRSSFLGNGRPEVWPLTIIALWKMTGPCHFIAVLLVPLVSVWLTLVGIRSLRRPILGVGGFERLALAMVTVGSACVLAVTPFALEDVPGSLNHLRWAYTPARYGLSFLSMAVLALALTLQDLVTLLRATVGIPKWASVWTHRLFTAYLGGSAVYQTLLVNERQQLENFAAYLAVVIVFFIAIWFLQIHLSCLTIYRHIRVAVWCGVVASAIVFISDLSSIWDAQFAHHYEQMYGTHIFRQLSSVGATRLALLDYRCHPFFGTRRQFHLCQPKRVPSLEILADYLRERGATHIVVRTREHGTPAGWDAYCGLGEKLSNRPSDYAPL